MKYSIATERHWIDEERELSIVKVTLTEPPPENPSPFDGARRAEYRATLLVGPDCTYVLSGSLDRLAPVDGFKKIRTYHGWTEDEILERVYGDRQNFTGHVHDVCKEPAEADETTSPNDSPSPSEPTGGFPEINFQDSGVVTTVKRVAEGADVYVKIFGLDVGKMTDEITYSSMPWGDIQDVSRVESMYFAEVLSDSQAIVARKQESGATVTSPYASACTPAGVAVDGYAPADLRASLASALGLKGSSGWTEILAAAKKLHDDLDWATVADEAELAELCGVTGELTARKVIAYVEEVRRASHEGFGSFSARQALRDVGFAETGVSVAEAIRKLALQRDEAIVRADELERARGLTAGDVIRKLASLNAAGRWWAKTLCYALGLDPSTPDKDTA